MSDVRTGLCLALHPTAKLLSKPAKCYLGADHPAEVPHRSLATLDGDVQIVRWREKLIESER
jgi:hypothetical protein